MTGIKLAAAFGLIAAVAEGAASGEVLPGIAAGAGVSLITWGIYKAKVDRHDKAIDRIESEKVDKAALDPFVRQLDRIERDVSRLTDHLLDK
jgi:hypothetical protein